MGTGYGKSLLAQLSADMQCLNDKVHSLIVTANDFLKLWGDTHYSTDNPGTTYASRGSSSR